jgi:hypothetical protein
MRVRPIRGYTNLLTIAEEFARLKMPLPDDWGTNELRRAVQRATEKRILELLFEELQEGRLRGMDMSREPEIPFDRSIHTTPYKAGFVGLKGLELEKAVSLLLGYRIDSGAKDAPVNVPRRASTKAQQQEDAILATLVGLNLDPMALPRRQRGKKWPVKQQVQDALRRRLGPVVFEKAWQRLREDERIQEA